MFAGLMFVSRDKMEKAPIPASSVLGAIRMHVQTSVFLESLSLCGKVKAL